MNRDEYNKLTFKMRFASEDEAQQAREELWYEFSELQASNERLAEKVAAPSTDLHRCGGCQKLSDTVLSDGELCSACCLARVGY